MTALGRGARMEERKGRLVRLSRKLALVVLVCCAGAGCAVSSDPAADMASTTLVESTGASTTAAVDSTIAAPHPAEPFSFGDPMYLDARDVVGSLAAPDGWEVWIDDETLVFDDGSDGVCEEGEVCPTGWVSIEAYVAADIDHPSLLMADDRDGVVAGLTDVVGDYYAWIGAQDWGYYEFDPIDPEPAQVGALPGVHFGYYGVRGDESIQHTDAYAGFDGTYLYLIWVRMPELIPTPDPMDFVSAFAPSLEEIVADLRLPMADEALVPELTSDWSLDSGDLLVSSWGGVVVANTAGTVDHVVSTEPTSQAHFDGMSGIVLQQASPRSGPQAMHPSELAIWWVPEPGAQPVVLHEPEPGAPASLFGVAEIDGSPHALYMVAEPGEHAYIADFVLVAHDLVTGEALRVGAIGGGEVWPDCVSWAVDRFVVSTTAEENSYFSFMSIDGGRIDLDTPAPAALDPGRDGDIWYASTCAALREPDGLVAVVLRTFEGPNRLVIVDAEMGTELRALEIDAETLAAGAEMEMWPGDIGPWQTRVQFVGDRVLITDLGFGLSPPIIADLTTGEVIMIPIEGMASLVP